VENTFERASLKINEKNRAKDTYLTPYFLFIEMYVPKQKIVLGVLVCTKQKIVLGVLVCTTIVLGVLVCTTEDCVRGIGLYHRRLC
jgi:hypothetical protein